MEKMLEDKVVSKNPATGEVLGEVPIMGEEEVRQVVEKAREAQREWAKRSPSERAETMRSLKQQILKRKDEIVKVLSSETGKPPIEALTGEIFTVLEALDYAIRKGPGLLKPHKVSHHLMKTYRTHVHYEPHGVLGMITPWNYPFLLSFGPALSALIAGNAVVIKPSEFTPLSVLEITKTFEGLDFPKGLLSVVTGYGPTGEALIRSGVNKVSFTGSVPTGRKVASLCGELLIPVSLELGGKDPMIVLEDAPLERAVQGAVWGGFCNTGQICASVERIYVEEGVYDHFVHSLKEEVKKLRQGGEDPYESDLGPMNNDRQFQIVDSQVKDALAKGARALVGGEGKAPYFKPTVLEGVTPEMDIYEKETFGPAINLFKVKSADEAVKLANDSPFGLTASVWTQDSERARAMAHQLNFGFIFVNDHLGPSGAGETAWGGFKDSGFGKTRGAEGIMEMVKVQYVSADTTGTNTAPYWYPYTKEKYDRFCEVLDQLYGGGFFSRLMGMLKLTWLTFRG